MEIAIHLPDDIVRVLPWQDIPRHMLENIALEGYQTGHLSEEQVRRLLGYSTRLEVHGFLKEHDVPLRYTLEDLEKDREAHRRLGLQMLVVADTSPLNYLVLIQHDALLPALYERVVIPPAVLADLQQPRTPQTVRTWVASPPAWLAVQRPSEPLNAQSYPHLGAGEREAIALAQELQAHLLLIDDANARAVAEQCALTATGTLGILETAATEGLIDLPGALALLQATTFHASKQLYQVLLDRDAARKGH